jgi:hypothetical protein
VLTNWIQSQDGLKIDEKPIKSRLELKTAFQLLHCREETLEYSSLEAAPVEEVVIRVACDYIRSISRRRKDIVYDLTVPGIP